MPQQILTEWQSAGLIRPLDAALADFCLQLAPQETDCAILVALVSQQLQRGHVCVELAGLEAELAAMSHRYEGYSPLDWWRERELAAWIDVLSSSRLVTQAPTEHIALLVLQHQRLYLYRMWQHEHRVAQSIQRNLQPRLAVSDDFAAGLQALFPASSDNTPNWQKVACAMAASGRFTLITGGPGTGKTTTVVRLLALLQQQALEQSGQPLRVRLAAPTGKAAARLTESIGAQIARLPVSDAVRASIPEHVSTLHRLLGSLPQTRRFRHHAGNPLILDVLVVDEASMIDLEMMDCLLQAMPAHARLILLGDKDQLASVEAGAVLGELCQYAAQGRYAPETIAYLEELCGEPLSMNGLEPGSLTANRLEQRTVMLRHSHRFDALSGIGRLASAVNAMDTQQAKQILSSDVVDVQSARFTSLKDLIREGLAPYLAHLAAAPQTNSQAPEFQRWAVELLKQFDRFRVLCALREGPYGVALLNKEAEIALNLVGKAAVDNPWYAGRPVMVTHNDYGLGLMNGDIGIAMRVLDETGRQHLQVAFPRNDGEQGVRFVLPSRLTAVDTVFAMTVHKSQGSEFEHCVLVLPERINPVLTKELLYTAITRAKERFTLVEAAAGVFTTAITRRVNRHSGLRDALEGRNVSGRA